MSIRRRRVIVSVGLALAVAAPAAAASWTSIPIDTSGMGPSLAVSNDGQVHVAYWVPDPADVAFSGGLMLASGDDSGFTTTSLSTDDLAYPSIAFDSYNHLHVAAYLQGGLGGLVYLTNATGVPISEVVTTDPQETAPSLAIAPTGEVRIAYSTLNDPGVYVATRGTSGWSSTRIADALTGRLSSAIDSNGASHLAWAVFDTGNGQGGIGYATGAGVSWSTRTLTTEPGDIDPDIAIGPDGDAHVVFSRQSARPQLSEAIVTPRHVRISRLLRANTRNPDVAFDTNGAEHIAYYSGDTFTVHHRTNAAGRWVDSDIAWNDGPLSLSVTSGGMPWIAYHSQGTCCPPAAGILIAHN